MRQGQGGGLGKALPFAANLAALTVRCFRFPFEIDGLLEASKFLGFLKAEFAKTFVALWPGGSCPTKQSFTFGNAQVVYRGDAPLHQPVLVELPVFIAV